MTSVRKKRCTLTFFLAVALLPFYENTGTLILQNIKPALERDTFVEKTGDKCRVTMR